MLITEAIEKGDISQVKKLLSKITANERDDRKRTPLHIAVSSGNEEIFKLIVSNKKIDINAQDDRGWTALHYAAVKNISICEQLLLNRNIKVNIVNEDKTSAFLFFCMLSIDKSELSIGQYYRMLNLFLQKGIDVNDKNIFGENSLHWAARSGNTEAIDFLCRNNCDANSVTRLLFTLFYLISLDFSILYFISGIFIFLIFYFLFPSLF